MKKRFTIDCYANASIVDYPANTYVTDSPEQLLECIRGIVTNGISGIYKFEVTDSKFDGSPKNIGMAPIDLDETSGFA